MDEQTRASILDDLEPGGSPPTVGAAAVQVLSGPSAGGEYEFSTPIVVGRADADLEILDPEVSRQHLKITPVAGGVEILDLGSFNGTWIEGRRLTKPTVLTRATAVRIGQTSFEVTPL